MVIYLIIIIFILWGAVTRPLANIPKKTTEEEVLTPEQCGLAISSRDVNSATHHGLLCQVL